LEHKGTKTIKTKRLVLRPFKPEDAEKMFLNWANDPEVTRYLTWDAHKDLDETRSALSTWVQSYEEESYYHWAIEFEGEPIGGIGLANVSDIDCKAYIGYCLGRAFWNKGFMSEALEAMLDFLFLEVGFNKLSAFHDTENPASGRVMEKVGMKQEGILRQEKRKRDGRFADMRLLAVLQEEWKSR